MLRRRTVSFALAGALVLAGCTVGPDYQLPVLQVPDAWSEAALEGVAAGEARFQTWWEIFDDPVLDELIRRARESNLDLEQAYLRILEARARLGIASGEKLPRVDASGSSTRSEPSDNGLLGTALPGVDFGASSLHSIGFDASWEIDVFGRIRRAVESAAAGYEASFEDFRDVQVSLLAEVAQNYVNVRTVQERINVAEANARGQRETLQLATDRYEGGLTSELDVRQAELNLAATEASIPLLRAALAFSLNRLAVLVGEPPGAVHSVFTDLRPLLSASEGVDLGLPVDLLRQRPDVRSAERRLAAQTALVGVATADLYPRFSLSGFFAFESTALGDLPKGSSVTWGFLPMVRYNLFDGNRIRARIDVEETRTEQAILRYEQVVLLALEEVESSFVALQQEKLRRGLLEQAVSASSRSVELVLIQYRSGLTDFQNVLDMQRGLFQQQDLLAASNGQVSNNLISLYKALGGGWSLDDSATSGAGEEQPQ